MINGQLSSTYPDTKITPLFARAMLCSLFLVFGFIKVTNFDQTIASMSRTGVPWPALFAWLAVIIEGPLAILLLLGILVRPLCLFFAFYTVLSALIGHAFWSAPTEQYMSMLTHFFKNIAIAGGFIALYSASKDQV